MKQNNVLLFALLSAGLSPVGVAFASIGVSWSEGECKSGTDGSCFGECLEWGGGSTHTCADLPEMQPQDPNLTWSWEQNVELSHDICQTNPDKECQSCYPVDDNDDGIIQPEEDTCPKQDWCLHNYCTDPECTMVACSYAVQIRNCTGTRDVEQGG